MKLLVSSDLTYDFAAGSEIIVSIQAAASPDQAIRRERLVLEPKTKVLQDKPDARGERRFLAYAQGVTRIQYEALIEVRSRKGVEPRLKKMRWLDLPQECLQYLTPSRYCPSDKFVEFAAREFGSVAPGGAQVLAIADWIYRNISYTPGVSDSSTTAEQTLAQRAGICRDFSHLGISLCRALGMPARAVSCYALNLTPPDFHAVFEVFLDGAWRIVDCTRLAPIEGFARIGVGRDAADIAFLTSSNPCTLVEQEVRVEALSAGRTA